MTDKPDTEEWSQEEMIDTFANTPHERHSIMVGFVKGLSEGSKFECDEKYQNEEHYYALGWSIGEIVDCIIHPKVEDDRQEALSQLAGVITKYAIIAFSSLLIGTSLM